MDQLVDSGINGLAITPINHPDVARKIKELSEKGIPVITVNTDIEIQAGLRMSEVIISKVEKQPADCCGLFPAVKQTWESFLALWIFCVTPKG